MVKRNWKRLHPNSISHGMELCLLHGKESRNQSVDRIADHMGLENKWMIYKWVESARIPAILIRPFEHACGIDYVTRYLAHSAHKLLIDIPTGRNATPTELNELSLAMTETSAALIKFHAGQTNAAETIDMITAVMESLAWHRGAVEKHAQPELGLFDEGDPS